MVQFSDVQARPRVYVPVIYTATIFLSAALLFFVQPLFTKVVLPHLGGAPSVWTTAMLFFQTVLIAGYVYAHLLTRLLGTRAQVIVHLAVWALALTALPLAVAEGWRYDADASSVVQTLTIFALGVGLPFFALSANAPLLQAWYARSDGPSADDPYFLYGASNLGSLLALLSFPLAAEPIFGASAIGQGWAWGFAALGLFLFASGVVAGPSGKTARSQPAAPVTPAQVFTWAALAFVPSSLMLAITTKISTDMGSIPLVWVVPLALYLLSFVATFTNRPWLSGLPLRIAFLGALVVLALLLSGLFDAHLTWLAISAMIVAFFAVTLFAHRKLYEIRPDKSQLTTFYITMSVGGALGGLFNSVLAPALFTDLLEGPLTVAAAALLLTLLRHHSAQREHSGRRLAIGGVACVAVLGILSWAQHTPGGDGTFRDRSFFGTHEVRDQDTLRVYKNGTTFHGAQRLSELDAERPTPLLYYHPKSPMAQVLTSSLGGEASSVGIVGLGVGALSCYRRPGQDWHFYEIDATVDRVARDPSLFTFMSSCAGDAPTHLGDARMVLAEQDLAFDVLVIDAYSSDAVPVHLTTTEAMELYMSRLRPGGVVVYHVSNRYFAIHRPLARSAEHLGLTARIQDYQGDSATDPGDWSSVVVMIARDAADFGPLTTDERWKPLESDGGRLWTDDYANLLTIIH